LLYQRPEYPPGQRVPGKQPLERGPFWDAARKPFVSVQASVILQAVQKANLIARAGEDKGLLGCKRRGKTSTV
jgi:hypothetical protein